MEKFPTLDLILRYGTAGAVALAVVAALCVAALVWPLWGAIALLPALVVGAAVLLLARSYVELVLLITDMLLPR